MKEKPPTKLPPIDGTRSVRLWEKFAREAEPSRAVCKKVQEQMAARVVRTESRPRGEKVPVAKPKRKRPRAVAHS